MANAARGFFLSAQQGTPKKICLPFPSTAEREAASRRRRAAA
jgi:hypothetical protein